MRSLSSAAILALLAGVVVTACSSSSAEAPAGPGESITAPGSPAPALGACTGDADCMAGLQCVKGVCASPNATNGSKDGDETDVDCGGTAAPPCEDGKACNAGGDCEDKICKGGTCAAPSPTDGVKNGSETDTDCGGPNAPPCGDAKACGAGTDCDSKVCTMGACAAPSGMDGQQNGTETDVDCGGTNAPACAAGKACGTGPDCTSKVCSGSICQPPTGTDGVKNGDESDVDCGGTTTGAAKCATSKQCNVHADCSSNGCSFDKKCATNPSCTQKGGGYTCGAGEGATGDCCAQAPIDGFPTTTIDRYGVTAGRMRALIERLGGDVRTFAQTVPGWPAAYNALVPSSVAEADDMLGPIWNNAPNDATGNESKRSCHAGSFGGHTYYTPGDGQQKYTQADLDPKALNCVGWHLAKAFCAWDNGRLATQPEIASAFRSGGATNAFPWTWHDTSTYVDDGHSQDPRLNHHFSYGFPGAPILDAGGVQSDVAWYVSPPGRFPLGDNSHGVSDMAGDLLPYVDGPGYLETSFVFTGSWENHGIGVGGVSVWKRDTAPESPNGYYALGFRCAHDKP